MSLTFLGALALVALAVAVLGTVHAGARNAAMRDRARVFDDVLSAVEDPVVLRGDGIDYPELRGRVGGHPVRLRVIVDALVLRKLPVLWLEVVVHQRVPVTGTVSVLLRPHGGEYFSSNPGFRFELPTPASFPRTARVAASTPDTSLDVLEPLAAFVSEPETKEVGVGPGGLRAVRLLASADQGAYRVSRRASFSGARVPAFELLRTVELLTQREVTT
ncbi:hypothetical protein [Pseudonocardia endophytica]|uniref:Uncharacterized protein n=1 Tax=Pseudonocardia endophytica TaxID=401976 RepID=A0A4R1HMJ6_PSEEN|nr:hypothetical protein [Pseudonocardia endophytica]TCK21785.1 hypothetical protein EV378_5776 [Pseudonocardia endophytica]